MIHTNRIVTVGEQECIIDRPIVLYRGDREVEIEFTLVGNEFMFSEEGNVIKSVNASHGQLVLNTPSGEHMFSELAECHEGKVVFVVTKEMIDEFIEMGFYSFQIRLYDSAEMKSRVTIPPVMNGFDIRNPIAAEDETNVVDQGIVDYARIFKDQSNEELPTFTWDGEYVKTEWAHHDVITENKMNKIEDALYSINANVKESDVVMLNALDNVKKDADEYVKEHMAEVEAEVDEFERNLNTGVERFKIDTNAAMTAHKNEVSEELESVNSQLADIKNNIKVNVFDFGAKGNGVEDDTLACQNALDYLNLKGGGILEFSEGVFLCNLVVYSNITIKGCGINTTLKSFTPNKDVIKSFEFDLLTGKQDYALPNEGISFFNIFDVVIDGNASTNITGYGLKVWGRNFTWNNIIVQNCCSGGIYTEFSTHNDPSTTKDIRELLESKFSNIKTFNNNGNGWDYRGPHDSNIDFYISVLNKGWAFRSEGRCEGITANDWNCWLCDNGYYFSGTVWMKHGIASGTKGIGIEFKDSIGSCKLMQVEIGGLDTGLILRGSSHFIDCKVQGQNDNGTCVKIDNLINSNLNLTIEGVKNTVKCFDINNDGINFINGIVVNADGITFNNDIKFHQNSYVNLINPIGNKHYLQLSTTDFKVNGWSPKLPLSDSTIIASDTLPTPTSRGGVLRIDGHKYLDESVTSVTAGDYNNILNILFNAGIIGYPGE